MEETSKYCTNKICGDNDSYDPFLKSNYITTNSYTVCICDDCTNNRKKLKFKAKHIWTNISAAFADSQITGFVIEKTLFLIGAPIIILYAFIVLSLSICIQLLLSPYTLYSYLTKKK